MKKVNWKFIVVVCSIVVLETAFLAKKPLKIDISRVEAMGRWSEDDSRMIRKTILLNKYRLDDHALVIPGKDVKATHEKDGVITFDIDDGGWTFKKFWKAETANVSHERLIVKSKDGKTERVEQFYWIKLMSSSNADPDLGLNDKPGLNSGPDLDVGPSDKPGSSPDSDSESNPGSIPGDNPKPIT